MVEAKKPAVEGDAGPLRRIVSTGRSGGRMDSRFRGNDCMGV